jgi:hypothetical protein
VQGRNLRLSPTFPGKTAALVRNSLCFEIRPVPWQQVLAAMVASMERLATAVKGRYFTAKT